MAGEGSPFSAGWPDSPASPSRPEAPGSPTSSALRSPSSRSRLGSMGSLVKSAESQKSQKWGRNLMALNVHRLFDLTADHKLPGEWLHLDQNHPVGVGVLVRASDTLKALEELKREQAIEEGAEEQAWINTTSAELFFAAVLMMYALLIGIDVEITVVGYELSPAARAVFFVVQVLFCIIFVVELVLRIRAEGIRYCSPCNPQGCFDFCIITLGVFELTVEIFGLDFPSFGPMRLLRLLRLARLVRIVMVCKELRLLFHGMIASINAVGTVSILLGMLIYLGALFTCILLGNVPELSHYFGSVGMALFTHFQIVTLEAWPDISDEVMDAAGPLWAVYFIVFICISSLALLNLVTGVVCEKMMMMGGEEDAECQVEAHKGDMEAVFLGVKETFEEVGLPLTACIDRGQFALLVTTPRMQETLRTLEISCDMDGGEMFDLLDDRRRGSLGQEQMAEAILRLRGSHHDPHLLRVHHDMARVRTKEGLRVLQLEEKVTAKAREDVRALEEELVKQLDEVESLALARLASTAPEGPPSPERASRAGTPGSPPPKPAPPWSAEKERVRGILDELDELCRQAEELVVPPPPRLPAAADASSGGDDAVEVDSV